MKKIFTIALILFSQIIFAQGQPQVCSLPSTSSGSTSDWLIKENSNCVNGTRKISVANFIATYSLTAGGSGTLTFVAPLTKTTNTVTISQSTTSTNGYLSSTDWNIFNNKQGAITATSPLAISTNTLTIAQSTTSTNGYLSSADWNTFNGKVTSVSGTSGQISSTGGATPVIGIATNYAGQTSLTTLGTIATGLWRATPVEVSYGGTGTATNFTAGSLVFAGTSGIYNQDNTNLLWDNTNKRLGVGINSPNSRLHVKGVDATTSNSSLNIESSTSPLLKIRNDGSFAFGTTTFDELYTFNGGKMKVITGSGGSPTDYVMLDPNGTLPSLVLHQNSNTGSIGLNGSNIRYYSPVTGYHAFTRSSDNINPISIDPEGAIGSTTSQIYMTNTTANVSNTIRNSAKITFRSFYYNGSPGTNPVSEILQKTDASGNYYLHLDSALKIMNGSKVRIDDGTQANGYVFTSNATGVGSWAKGNYELFLDPDFQHVGNYSGVPGFGVQLGVWDTALTPSINDVVIWNLQHYVNITGAVGSDPDIDATDWTLLPTDATHGFITEKNFVIRDTTNGNILYRYDSRGNVVNAITFDRFQFGNDNVTNNISFDNSTFDITNNYGIVSGNYVQGTCFFGADRNYGTVSSNNITSNSAFIVTKNQGAASSNSVSNGSSFDCERGAADISNNSLNNESAITARNVVSDIDHNSLDGISQITADDNAGNIRRNSFTGNSTLDATSNTALIQACSFSRSAGITGLTGTVINKDFTTNGNVTTLFGSATLNFASTAAGASTDLTISVTGAAISDVVGLGVDNASTLANGVFTAWVSATNTVKVRFTNTNLVSALDPASGTFKVQIQRR